ncbi:hypothetical protein VY88_19335 [Azospirillum thiophilum]|uniref:DUF2239 domain-containing protein n=1 Tax=Azospirillum thiophilum TaxID=528244 RepID=A0AAC8W2T1_9PROT|nr:DUF2239 family protein [Azospirillum thiophilum]ALG74007.1 hypothetical protein AL072_23585 [Azospirillum thiophilum]KJR63649.1 hypothetical protein VY88_19335 [Azospirillum thiophilum]
MSVTAETPCTAFRGDRRLAAGDAPSVARALRTALAAEPDGPLVLVFDDATGRAVDLDLRETGGELAAPHTPRGPGRPKLGVVAREVTLLPRHWDWLNAQPGGASVALRKLVDEARKEGEAKDRMRRAQEAAYCVMSALAGDRPGYEEAVRALYAADRLLFDGLTADWPADVRDYARALAADAFAVPGAVSGDPAAAG